MRRDTDVEENGNNEPLCLEKNWVSFDYLYHSFQLDLFDSDEKLYWSLMEDREKVKLVKIIARNSENIVFGYLNGKMYVDDQGNNIFELRGMQNKGVSDGASGVVKKEEHIPNLMKEVVVHLLNSRKVDKVITSSILTYGSILSFDRVLADERINGERRYLDGDEEHKHPYYVFWRDQH